MAEWERKDAQHKCYLFSGTFSGVTSSGLVEKRSVRVFHKPFFSSSICCMLPVRGKIQERGYRHIRTITMHFLNTLWSSFSLCASLLFWLSCSLGASLLLKECRCLVCQRAPRLVLVCFSSLRKKLLWTCWYPQSPLDSAISPINTTGVVFETTSWLI